MTIIATSPIPSFTAPDAPPGPRLIGLAGRLTTSPEGSITAYGGWRNNAEMMADVAELEWLPGPVLDLSYGLGKFWSVHRPAELVANDLNPDKGDHTHDVRALPAEWADAFGSVVWDGPYKMQGTSQETAAMDARYGVDVAMTAAERLELLVEGAIAGAACVRPGGWLHVKCQAQVVSNRFCDQPGLLVGAVLGLGDAFRLEQIWHLVSTPMAQPRAQKRPRNNASQLLTFRRRPWRSS